MAPAGHAGHLASADPFMRWAATTLEPRLRAAVPAIYAPAAAPSISWALLVATAAVMAWAGRDFYVRAWRNLRHGSADMNTLVAVGTGAAFLYSAAATVAPQAFVRAGVAPDLYFEAALFIIALVLVGRALEARAKHQHHAGAVATGGAAAADCPGARSPTAARTTGRSAGCATATSSWSGQASGCRSTASSSRGAPPSTSRCSPESRCRWPRRRRRGSSAAP